MTTTPTPTSVSLDLAYLQAHLARLDMPLRLAVRRAQQIGFDPNNDFQGLYISETELERHLSLLPGSGIWDNPFAMPDLGEDYYQQQDYIARQLANLEETAQTQNTPLRLRHIVEQFGLTDLDLDILLLCVGSAVDRRYERLYGFLQDDVTKREPSINLLINLLGQDWGQRNAILQRLSDHQPLIHHKLIHAFAEASGQPTPFIRQLVRADRRVVAYLQGVDYIPHDAETYIQVLDKPLSLDDLVLEDKTKDDLRRLIQQPQPLFYFSGNYGSGKRSIAHAIAYEQGYPLVEIDLQAIQKQPLNRDVTLLDMISAGIREGLLRQAGLLISRWETLLDDLKSPPRQVWEAVLDYPYPVFISGRKAWEAFGTHRDRPMLRLNLDVPHYHARLSQWQFYLQGTAIDPAELAYKFKLTGGQIRDAVNTAYDLAAWRGDATPTLEDLYEGSRAQSNRNLSALAIKIKPRHTWDQIILPPDPLQQLREMSDRLKHAITVYEKWGFDGGIANARGITVLFAGQSGTGKTMAAEVIGNELGLELFKIDLSSVVSKYIGETEKNLATIFDEAAQSNAILFFDEADALFGKRTEVQDSHDRYANIEVGYLLQRLETYDGVGILATNLRQNIDEAFTRRMDFLIDFPFPDEEYRAQIWQVSFPPSAPLGASVDFDLLAERYRLAGGNIRNAALASAFFAASEGGSHIEMKHIFQAIRREYQKMGKLLDEI